VSRNPCPDPSVLGTAPLRVLAERFGVGVSIVRKWEKNAGIDRSAPDFVNPWMGKPRFKCPDESILFTKSSAELETLWGISHVTVKRLRDRWREVNGEPPVRERRGRGRKIPCPDPSVLWRMTLAGIAERFNVSTAQAHYWRKDYTASIYGRDGTGATRGKRFPPASSIPQHERPKDGQVSVRPGQLWEDGGGSMCIVRDFPDFGEDHDLGIINVRERSITTEKGETGWAQRDGCVIFNKYGVVLRANGVRLVYGSGSPWPVEV
jgi:transposase